MAATDTVTVDTTQQVTNTSLREQHLIMDLDSIHPTHTGAGTDTVGLTNAPTGKPKRHVQRGWQHQPGILSSQSGMLMVTVGDQHTCI